MESKRAIYDLLPKEYYPATLFFSAGTDNEKIMAGVYANDLKFPLVAKPDIGMQGKAVKKLLSMDDLLEYSWHSKVDFLVQEFVPYENEVGIFYYRYPDQPQGKISGIVSKEFLTIYGDGISTMESLIRREKRHTLQLKVLAKQYGSCLNDVLQYGETRLLVPYGNHVRGAKFTDASHLIDSELTETIDRICRNVNGFYFGRLDIRYCNWQDLKAGKNFSIIELNGAGSEPTHIYDPGHSIFFAWKEIIRHLNILYRVSKLNHKMLRKPYMNILSGLEMLNANRKYVKLISEDQQRRA